MRRKTQTQLLLKILNVYQATTGSHLLLCQRILWPHSTPSPSAPPRCNARCVSPRSPPSGSRPSPARRPPPDITAGFPLHRSGRPRPCKQAGGRAAGGGAANDTLPQTAESPNSCFPPAATGWDRPPGNPHRCFPRERTLSSAGAWGGCRWREDPVKMPPSPLEEGDCSRRSPTLVARGIRSHPPRHIHPAAAAAGEPQGGETAAGGAVRGAGYQWL